MMLADTTQTVQFIAVVLSIASPIAPILFGFVTWRMTKVFVTKDAFEDYKRLAQTEREAVKDSINRIERNLEWLVQEKRNGGSKH
jgi:hypothetical protein